jgi:hypothetical protein
VVLVQMALVDKYAVVLVEMVWFQVLHLAMVLVLSSSRVMVLQSARNHSYHCSELDQLDTDSIPVCALVHKEMGLVLVYNHFLL